MVTMVRGSSNVAPSKTGAGTPIMASSRGLAP
jgi:hypothetical protein